MTFYVNNYIIRKVRLSTNLFIKYTQMEDNKIFKFNLVFGCIFHNVISYVKFISTNESMYVMVAFECGIDY